jgi:hypothetical protein
MMQVPIEGLPQSYLPWAGTSMAPLETTLTEPTDKSRPQDRLNCSSQQAQESVIVSALGSACA